MIEIDPISLISLKYAIKTTIANIRIRQELVLSDKLFSLRDEV